MTHPRADRESFASGVQLRQRLILVDEGTADPNKYHYKQAIIGQPAK